MSKPTDEELARKEELQLQKILKQQQKERNRELYELEQSKLVQKQETREAVERTIRDRGTLQQEDFTAKGKKEAGVSAGYVATENVSGKTFILKQMYKRASDAPTPQDDLNRRDGVNELVGSTLYQLLLYDSAPKEELVVPNQEHENSLYVRSKFFDNVEQLGTFSGLQNYDLNPFNQKLKTLEGFERTIAACHILGEIDYHAGNLMVEATPDGRNVVRKIDHGRSFIDFRGDFASMVTQTNETFDQCGYADAIALGNMTFSAEEYAKSLKQMTSQLTPEQIDNVVDQKISELKKAGFDPKGIIIAYDDGAGKEHELIIKDYDQLSKIMKDNIKNNVELMRDTAEKVEVITKFTGVSEAFRKGGWLEEMATSPQKDPVLYAAAKGIKIEGKDALTWAHENNYRINDAAISVERTSQEQSWSKTKGQWKEQETTVGSSEIYTKQHTVLEYLEKRQSDGQPLSPAEKRFLQNPPEPNPKNVKDIVTGLVFMAHDKTLPERIGPENAEELRKKVNAIPKNVTPDALEKHLGDISSWSAERAQKTQNSNIRKIGQVIKNGIKLLFSPSDANRNAFKQTVKEMSGAKAIFKQQLEEVSKSATGYARNMSKPQKANEHGR